MSASKNEETNVVDEEADGQLGSSDNMMSRSKKKRNRRKKKSNNTETAAPNDSVLDEEGLAVKAVFEVCRGTDRGPLGDDAVDVAKAVVEPHIPKVRTSRTSRSKPVKAKSHQSIIESNSDKKLSLTLEDADHMVECVNDVHERLERNAKRHQELQQQLTRAEEIQAKSTTHKGALLAWRRQKDLIVQIEAVLAENRAFMDKHPTVGRRADVEQMNAKYEEACATALQRQLDAGLSL